MANVIKIKRRTSGSGALDALAEGELGVDLTDNEKLYVGTSGGNELVAVPTSGGTISGNLTLTGQLSANTKSFLIPHPSKPDMKLRHGSLEGPENGVYVRGKGSGQAIELPDYWSDLVDEDSITVNLTPCNSHQFLYVKEVSTAQVIVSGHINKDYFFTVFGERKDVPKMVVEE